MPLITIDNREIEATQGATVLQVALENGIFIPHFCWHPVLSVAGNCRMCVVEVVGRPKLEISCNLPVADGMVVKTDTPAVKQMRKNVLEFLLINHPTDCPICDQAGECLLQDYHFKYSGQASRFMEKKVRKPKVVDVGNNVKLDDERCVLCTRCVRFCAEVAKTPELAVAERGDHSFITTAPGKILNNPYSMNVVDYCPVGALTSKDFRFKKRVWFLKSTRSVCPHCSNGCPVWLDHEGGIVYRMRPRSLNGCGKVKGVAESQLACTTILCDEGRLSYKEWQGDPRIFEPIANFAGDIISKVREALKNDVVVIVSSQCSCEEIDALSKISGRIYKTGRKPADPSEDNIIRKKDKNPNSFYLEKLGIKDIPSGLSGDTLVVVDSLADEDLSKISGKNFSTVVQITHDKSLIMQGATVVLPWATFAETDGTFVNFAGVSQKFEKAFEPKGSAKSAAEWIVNMGNL